MTSPQYTLLEQYGNPYIRFPDEEHPGYTLQVKIQPEQEAWIRQDSMTMEEALQYSRDLGLCDLDRLRKGLIADYFRVTHGFASDKLEKVLARLSIYPDIFLEFYRYVVEEAFLPEDTPGEVTVRGLTARGLWESNGFFPYDAYSFLISVRQYRELGVGEEDFRS